MSTAEKLRSQGRAEGKAEGKAETLLILMTKRFGPLPSHFATRLHSAPLADLDRWTDRILDAKSLSDVFADS